MLIVLDQMKSVTQLIKYVEFHVKTGTGAQKMKCVTLPSNFVFLVRKTNLRCRIIELLCLVCKSQIFSCEWPDRKCNTERHICGKQCTENRNCKEGEFCDTRMGVCVPGKKNFLIFWGDGSINLAQVVIQMMMIFKTMSLILPFH
mgnify:CR=1 FL=1